jgi:hypothetical protein
MHVNFFYRVCESYSPLRGARPINTLELSSLEKNWMDIANSLKKIYCLSNELFHATKIPLEAPTEGSTSKLSITLGQFLASKCSSFYFL